MDSAVNFKIKQYKYNKQINGMNKQANKQTNKYKQSIHISYIRILIST